MEYFSGKRILFFAPSFFGYEVEIEKQLVSMGAIVKRYDERPANNFVTLAFIRLFPNFALKAISNYFDQIFRENKNENFDYVFFFKGETVSIGLIKKIRTLYPEVKVILYLIDSLRNYPHIKDAIPYFDKASSFDPEDTHVSSKIIFRPLFYVKDYEGILDLEKCKPENDLLFIGTVHSDRWAFLNKIKKQALEIGCSVKYYLYFQHIIVYIFRKLTVKSLKSLPYKHVSFSKLRKDGVIELMSNSKVVVDIQHPKQTGLTIRTIEVLGARRKLITTNSSILEYDFYNPKNIQVVDRINPSLPEFFLTQPYEKLSEELYKKYSLKQCLIDIFA